MKDLLRMIKSSFLPSLRINSRETLQEAAESFGILPFFPNNVRGLSVEEMCAPGMLFGGNYAEGCWEWKGPVIRKGTSAYGRFFNRKAGFVSLDLLPDFLNFRRHAYPIKEGSTDEMLFEIIRENDSLTSTELKKLIFGEYERTRWDELPEFIRKDSKEILPSREKKGRKSLESPLQRLQMGGWIIISDFEYKKTKSGERYGWGVARYSTPEISFGDRLKDKNFEDPMESFEFLVNNMKERWPRGSKDAFRKLLK